MGDVATNGNETPEGGGAAKGQDFVGYLARMRPHIEGAIVKVGSHFAVDNAVAADDLSRYLYDPLARFVGAGGKRVRPALCLLGAEAVGGRAERALCTAVAIELFQAAALIHDDIADAGTTRRGERCLHLREGMGLAINVGDRALMGMYGTVLHDEGLDAETRHAVLRELHAMAERTAEGQALDIGWARDGRWDLTVDDYLRMATHKTAWYSAASPLACGALCGGATAAQLGALRNFGLLAGLAFQLQDDLLNLVGNAAAQGKDFRSDITEGKRTMIAVHALAHLDAGHADELRRLLSSGSSAEGDLARAVGLMESAGSVAFVRNYAADLVADAKAALATVNVTPAAAQTLASVADFFVSRDA